MNYKKAYALLVGAISDAIDELYFCNKNFYDTGYIIEMLINSLEEVEELYINSTEEDKKIIVEIF